VVDISVAKQISFAALGEHAFLRFQANFFNAFNLLNLTPITNGNANPAANNSERRLWQSCWRGRWQAD
jgi:hypothetical protein